MAGQCLKEYANVQFPENCRAILDVTQPPYCLDNTGKEDCTQKLRDLLDNMMLQLITGLEATCEHLLSIPDPDCVIALEAYKRNGKVSQVSFPEEEPQNPVLYFPNGTYLVSDTISYTLENLQNICPNQAVPGYEMNMHIIMMGQSREGTILKLKDGCPGFEYGNERPVVSFMQGERSNVAWGNFFENMTIDVGSGNAGAVGLIFFGNNSGAVRNVTIRSSDQEGRGAIGLWAKHEIISGCCVRNVSVEGFNIGIKVTPTRNYVAMANLYLKGQRKSGIVVEQSVASFHNVHIRAHVPAFLQTGALSHVVLTDATIECDTGNCIYPAVRIELGGSLVRNLHTQGFSSAINLHWGDRVVPDGDVEEFCTHPLATEFGESARCSLNIPCPSFPDRPECWDLSQWHCVNDYGAVGDGKTDDTQAVQAAMDAGGTVWFQPGRYFLSKTVVIPENVNHVHFMNCDLAIPDFRRDAEKDSVFSIIGSVKTPLLMQKLSARHNLLGSIRLVRHDGIRTLHLRDIHTQTNPCYFNTVPGGMVFLEDVVCTTGTRIYRHQPNFHFMGQTVFGHSVNPERSMHEIINDGGTLWLMGFKIEGDGPLCETYHGGKTDILGGTVNSGKNGKDAIVINHDSSVSASFACAGFKEHDIFDIIVEERRGFETRHILRTELPERFAPFCRVPLYIGHAEGYEGSNPFLLY